MRDCLIADRDGVYDPATANGRLLLGLKGTLSELELHTIRSRVTAGLLPNTRPRPREGRWAARVEGNLPGAGAAHDPKPAALRRAGEGRARRACRCSADR